MIVIWTLMGLYCMHLSLSLTAIFSTNKRLKFIRKLYWKFTLKFIRRKLPNDNPFSYPLLIYAELGEGKELYFEKGYNVMIQTGIDKINDSFTSGLTEKPKQSKPNKDWWKETELSKSESDFIDEQNKIINNERDN